MSSIKGQITPYRTFTHIGDYRQSDADEYRAQCLAMENASRALLIAINRERPVLAR